MRRTSIVLSALVLAGLAVTYNLAASPAEAGAVMALQNRPVNITVMCNGGDLGETTVVPFTLRLRRSLNERARFSLLGGSAVASVTIRVKEDSSWPFDANNPNPSPPFTLQRGGGNAVTTGAIVPGAMGSYFYDIIADCGSGPQVIDPRMDIDP